MTREIGSNAAPDADDAKDIVRVLEALIPRSLDDVVRQNRDQFQIGLATADEIAALAGGVERGPVKATLDDWRLIAIRSFNSERSLEPDRVSLALLGRDAERRSCWLTSAVQRIDQNAGLVRTTNSRYGIGVAGVGEPPSDELIHVAAVTYLWGFGGFIGAPKFFY